MKKMELTQMTAINGGACVLALGAVTNFLTLVLPVATGTNAISNTLSGLLSGFTVGGGALGIPGALSSVFGLGC